MVVIFYFRIEKFGGHRLYHVFYSNIQGMYSCCSDFLGVRRYRFGFFFGLGLGKWRKG